MGAIWKNYHDLFLEEGEAVLVPMIVRIASLFTYCLKGKKDPKDGCSSRTLLSCQLHPSTHILRSPHFITATSDLHFGAYLTFWIFPDSPFSPRYSSNAHQLMDLTFIQNQNQQKRAWLDAVDICLIYLSLRSPSSSSAMLQLSTLPFLSMLLQSGPPV